jgi:hypothetical protein
MNYLQIPSLHKRITSTVERAEFVRERISYIILRGQWCDIVFLSERSDSKLDKIDDVKDSFYKELEPVFNKICYEISMPK